MSARAASAPGAGVLDRLQVLRSAPTPLRGALAATWTPSPRTGVGPLRVPGPGLQPSSHDTTTTRTDPAGSTLARPDFGPKDGVHLRRYTREAGVRSLEREINAVCRKVARAVVLEGKQFSDEISAEKVAEHLGVPRYRPMMAEEKNEIGIATGLAWTEAGGELLFTESTLMPGKGRLTLTGQLGEVMQESAKAAMSYVRSRAEALGIQKDFHHRTDVHIHVPEGAIPKDGPSAGITLATALVSNLTRVPTRRDVAMTGEITLRGKVLPISGVKEKVLAAHRAEVTTIILPKDNEKDVADIPKEVLDVLTLHLVESMDEVLKIALAEPLTAQRPSQDRTDSRCFRR